MTDTIRKFKVVPALAEIVESYCIPLLTYALAP